MREEIINLPPMDSEQPFYIPMVGISYCDSSYKIVRKCSFTCCIEYIIKGIGTLEIGGKILHPCQGDIYILPMLSDHVYYADPEDPWEKIWIDARGILPNELLRIYNIESTYLIKGLDLYSQFKEIYNMAGNKKLEPVFINQQAALIFHNIIQKIAAHVHIEHTEISDEAKILKAYLDRNIESNISIKELSELIYRSPSQTIRIFKKAFQCTPYDYALNLKIEAAKLLLKNTSLKIKQIARQVGFSDEHYFANVFRNKTGMSPKNFRNT